MADAHSSAARAAALVAVAAGLAAASPAGAMVNITPLGCCDDVQIGIGFTLTTDRELTVGPQASYGHDVFDERGWEAGYAITASVPLIWINIPRGRVRGGLGPLTFRTEFIADPPDGGLPNDLGFKPSGAAGIELTIPIEGNPSLDYYTELRLGIPLGEDSYRIDLPLLRYGWNSEQGDVSRWLGTSVDLIGAPGACAPAAIGEGFDCTFTRAKVTFRSLVPEPATWALFILGFGVVGMQLRRVRALPA
jgi:hypothetical protein